MSSVAVCYFFQGELGESLETPNAFMVRYLVHTYSVWFSFFIFIIVVVL